MTYKQKQEIYNHTGATVYFNRQRKCFCAVWLDSESQNSLYFGNSYTVKQVIDAITEKRLTSYTFSK